MRAIRLTLFGHFQLEVRGEPRRLPTRKCEGLLAYLALNGARPHRRDALGSLLWADVPAPQARHNLRQAIWRLRRALAGAERALATDAYTIRLDPDAIRVDALVFAGRIADGAPGAADLHRGPLLDGLVLHEPHFDAWLAAERRRYQRMAAGARAGELRDAQAAGDVDRAISLASSLLAIDPTQEDVHRTLMRLFRDSGRASDALRQYNECAAILDRELGVEPEAATRELCQDILKDRARSHSRRRDAGDVRRAGTPVLVLEPDPVSRAGIERMLQAGGYTVVLGHSADVLPSHQNVTYGAILLREGTAAARVQFLSRLRARGYRGGVLFVAGPRSTGHAGRQQGIRVSFLRRPVRAQALLDTLDALLRESPGDAATA